MADITQVKTGKTVGVPLEKYEQRLIRKPYWRAYYFRIGCGIPLTCIREASLKKATSRDYTVSLMKDGKVFWEG